MVAYKEEYARGCLYGFFTINATEEYLKQDLNEIVNKYYKRKKLLEELIEFDGEILPHSIQLQNVILSEKEFYTLYSQIDKPSIAKSLGRKITKYFTQKNKK